MSVIKTNAQNGIFCADSSRVDSAQPPPQLKEILNLTFLFLPSTRLIQQESTI